MKRGGRFLKSSDRPARKRCAKCGRAGYFPTRARTCDRTAARMGGIFFCGGALEAAPIKRAPRPKPSKLAQAEKAHARAIRTHHAAVLREKRATAAVRRSWGAVTRTNAALVRARLEATRAREQATTRSYFDDSDS